jgi:hypothetical protein
MRNCWIEGFLKKCLVTFGRRDVPILAFVFLFFVVDIHAFNDIALRAGAAGGSAAVIKTVLYLGANVHAADDQALGVAAHRGHTEIVEILLDHGADIHAKNDVVLFLAIQSGKADTVKLILDRGNFIPSCEPIWRHKRYIWYKEAAKHGNSEIITLIRNRTKPFSAPCASLPSETDFDQWK